MALATAAQVRALAPGLSTADDTTIDALLARIDAAFARFCGHPTPDSGAPTREAATYTTFPGRRVELLVGATHSWSDLPRANRVIVSAGYVVASHPVLTEAAIVQTIHQIGNTSAAGSDTTSTRAGSRSVAPLSLLPEVREMLTDYRLAVP
jgi:hypothetical protein